MSSDTDKPEGLAALRKYEYVPRGARATFEPTPAVYSPRPARARVPRTGNRWLEALAYITFVWGMAILANAVVSRYSIPGLSLHGEWTSVAIGAAVAIAGAAGITRWRHDLDLVVRYVPAVSAAWAIAVAAHLAVSGPALTYGPYPSATRTSFRSSCMSGELWHFLDAVPSECNCALRWFEAHEPLGTFNADVASIKNGEGLPWDVAGGLASCSPPPS